MSRVGNKLITLPSNVTVVEENGSYTVTGSKGVLKVPSYEGIGLEAEGQTLHITALDDSKRNFQGLIRSLLANAVHGVANGWTRNLELHGVGMRAALNGNTLNLSLGFSHPVLVTAPAGISFTVVKNVITIAGIDKQLVGETAAKIRVIRPPEPYKGKGIRYSDEKVRRKAGKTGKAGK